MYRSKINSIGFISLIIVLSGLFFASFCELSQGFIDSTNAAIDTLRKRECILNVTCRNQPITDKEISVRQIHNDFGFGASIARKFFTKTDSAAYGSTFLSYFDWATPENDMKWNVIEKLDDYQDYQAADWLVNWCSLHNIKIRGHNLFWNEKPDWIPEWTKELNTDGFKAAMKQRIDGAMNHFKGKVAHWDLINEIVHGTNGLVQRPGMLVTLSGDTNVFSWVFKEARAIDSNVLMGVNEFNIIEQASAAKEYITEIKDIESKGGKIDIIGLEGHFSDYMERSSYQERIDTVAGALTQPLWLTEVDFSIDTLLRADKMEELMRTCFAHPRVGGLVLWVWWEGNRWRNTLTSFLVDSNYTENELGLRWRTVREGWKTKTSGTTGSDGQFGFKGFHGEYIASVKMGDSIFTDTFYLEPGQGAQDITVDLDFSVGVSQKKAGNLNPGYLKLNGKTICFELHRTDNKQLFMSMYALSGRLLSRIPISVKNDEIITTSPIAPGCHVVHIGTIDQTLYAGLGVQLR